MTAPLESETDTADSSIRTLVIFKEPAGCGNNSI